MNYLFQMDDSGIDSDTTKRHGTTIKENDRVIIYNYNTLYFIYTQTVTDNIKINKYQSPHINT